MLSYQHAFHAGNLADIHKHALLAWMLDYLTRKDKPLSYIESHAGRGLYHLDSAEALKTGEAEQGIAAHSDWFDAAHPYARACEKLRETHGETAYPGSPLIAAHLLRDTDSLHLGELHPAEFDALRSVLRHRAKINKQDGMEMALALAPPTPRRGLLLIDPPYEIKDDYDTLPRQIAQLTRAWNVGIIALWYPILASGAHHAMVQKLTSQHSDALHHEVRFPPARPGHGMVGSGMFIINPPYGLETEAKRLSALFNTL